MTFVKKCDSDDIESGLTMRHQRFSWLKPSARVIRYNELSTRWQRQLAKNRVMFSASSEMKLQSLSGRSAGVSGLCTYSIVAYPRLVRAGIPLLLTTARETEDEWIHCRKLSKCTRCSSRCWRPRSAASVCMSRTLYHSSINQLSTADVLHNYPVLLTGSFIGSSRAAS